MVLAIQAGCAMLSANDSSGEALELAQRDSEIVERTAAVKAALIEAADIDAAAIQVTFDGSTLRLDGFVDTEEESTSAERVAREEADGHALVNALVARRGDAKAE